MGKIAFVFAGQGDQFPGMGEALCRDEPEAARIFELLDRIRPNTSDQCFRGTKEELRSTAVTQPCVFALEMAAAQVLRSVGIQPDAVAGFSMGEVAAWTFAGAFTLEEGFRLIIQRGAAMEEAARKEDSFMDAVLRLDKEQVETACMLVKDVYAVNFNCPGQISVAGKTARREAFEKIIRDMGGRTVPLAVSGAFHCPLMDSAARRFQTVLSMATVRPAEIPVFSNVTAAPETDGARQLLARQIVHPVRWEETICNMVRFGVDTFIEIGPKTTLSAMIRKTDPSVKTYAVSDLSRIMNEVKAC